MPAEIALPSALTLATDTHHVGRDTSHVGLLALIFTERRNVARRAAVRQTWLSHAWSLPSNFTWRYAFVEARAPRTGASKQSALRGDTLVLASVEESYLNLVHKTVAALRWSLVHVPFDTLLKTDDDSIVHVGRAAAWLAALPSRQRVYAGRVVRDSQVVRSNFTRADLVHPDWFPADFLKWAVGVEQMPDAVYPPYCAGAGYFVGRCVLLARNFGASSGAILSGALFADTRRAQSSARSFGGARRRLRSRTRSLASWRARRWSSPPTFPTASRTRRPAGRRRPATFATRSSCTASRGPSWRLAGCWAAGRTRARGRAAGGRRVEAAGSS